MMLPAHLKESSSGGKVPTNHPPSPHLSRAGRECAGRNLPLEMCVAASIGGWHFSYMSTLAEIESALPQLTNEELMRVEAMLHATQRQRGVGILFDDAYGVWTEDDQASVAAEAWADLDKGAGKS
jgi:hypothetical protein